MKRISRKEALALGLPFYHGKFCERHQSCERGTRTKECPGCVADRNRRYREENKERLRGYYQKYHAEHRAKRLLNQRRWRQENADQLREKSRAYYLENREHFLSGFRRYYEQNRARELERKKKYRDEKRDQVRAGIRRWQKENPAKVAANDAVRRGRLAHSLKGLRADQVAQIEAIYREARQMGMHVDHIVPLAGCRVCGRKGAHVPENLQPLTAEENVMKGNRCMECWCREQRNAYLATLAAERCASVAAGGG